MAAIQSLGVGSGLLTSELVDDIIASEREPVEARLDSEQELLEARISAYGEVVSSVSSFNATLQTLALPSSFSANTANSSNDTFVSATASSVATAGTYVVEVAQLAQNHSLASGAFDALDEVVGSGSLTFRFGTIDFDGSENYQGFTVNPEASTRTITIDSTNNTLAGIRDAINDADFGVQASIVDDGSGYRLLFTSEEGGADNAIELVATGDAAVRAFNYNLASETATLNALTSVGSTDIAAGAGLDTADKAFVINYKGTELAVTVTSDPAVDTGAEVLAAVQTALDAELVAQGFSAGDVVASEAGDRLRFGTLATGFAETLEVIADGSAAAFTSAAAISDGFDFSANNATFSVSIDGGGAQAITLDAATASRQETIDAINAAFLGAGIDGDVVASLGAGNELVLTRTASGSGASIAFSAVDAVGTAASAELGLIATTVTGLDGFGLDTGQGQVGGSVRLNQTIKAQDANLTVNGLSVSRGSNLVAGVIGGTTLNIKAVTAGPVTITVESDPGSLVEDIQAFVDAYNDLKLLSAELTAFDPGAGTNGKGSLLMGDSTLRAVTSSINALLRSTVTGLTGSVRSLAEIGITTNQNNAFQLTFDTTKFTQKYQSDPNTIKALFANAGSTTDAQVEYVSASAKTSPGTYAVEIEALATVGSYRGHAIASLGAGNIVIDDANDEFTVSLNGISADVTLTQGSYPTAADLAQQIQSQINSNSTYSSGNHAVTVTYNSSESRFELASNIYGDDSEIRFLSSDANVANSMGFLLADQGPFQTNQLGGLSTAGGSSAENFDTAVTLDADTSFELAIDGISTGLLTIPGSSGTPIDYNTPDDLIAAISTQIDNDGAFLAKPASTPISQIMGAGYDFSADARSISLSLDGGDTEIEVLIDGDASTVSFGGETPGTLANTLAAVQDAIDATALNGQVTASLDASNYLIFSTVTTGTAATLDVTKDGTGAEMTGGSALSGTGFDFATTNASFDIAIDGEAPLSITIDAATTDRDATVALVQAALDDAGLGTRVTASLDGSNQLVLTRSSDTGSDTSIQILNTDVTANAQLGLGNSSVNGLDGFAQSVASHTGRDAKSVNIEYSYDSDTGLGRFIFSSDDHADLIEFDQVSTSASNKLGIFIGDGTVTTDTAGRDVEGTINGIEASGKGQLLQAQTGAIPAKPGFYLNAAIGNLASSTTADTFKVTVDGVSSTAITLGTITITDPDAVASSLQSAINNNPAILAGGVGVTVEYDTVTGGFGIISRSTGPTSSVTLGEITGIAGSIFGFAAGQGAMGATGTIAQGTPDPSSGIRIRVTGGGTGDRGSVSFVRGVANQLDTLLDSFLSSNGLLTNRTESLNDELADIEQERVDLNARLVLSEDRLRASFLANDLIISNLNTTSDFLSSQLKLLEGLVSSRNSDD